MCETGKPYYKRDCKMNDVIHLHYKQEIVQEKQMLLKSYI